MNQGKHNRRLFELYTEPPGPCLGDIDRRFPVAGARSRILGGSAREGGMPLYKYISNRSLTAFQNLLGNAKLSEYHTGYRAFSREVIESLALHENSDDFVFDNQMLAQVIFAGFKIGEVSCPAAYFDDASSINFRRSLRYGLGVLAVSVQLFLQRRGLMSFSIFDPQGRRLEGASAKHTHAAAG